MEERNPCRPPSTQHFNEEGRGEVCRGVCGKHITVNKLSSDVAQESGGGRQRRVVHYFSNILFSQELRFVEAQILGTQDRSSLTLLSCIF